MGFAWPFSHREKPQLSGVWGDGFEMDGLEILARVSDWEFVSPDEYVRLYPRLVGRELPEQLLAQFQTRTDILRARCARDAAGGAMHDPLRIAQRLDATCWREIDDLSILEKILLQIAVGQTVDYRDAWAEQVAYHTAIHPAYLWPEAVIRHQLFSTLAWLGILQGGRSAYMTIDVAEYLTETIVPQTRSTARVDESLARRIGNGSLALALLAKAKQRICGHAVIVQTLPDRSIWTKASCIDPV